MAFFPSAKEDRDWHQVSEGTEWIRNSLSFEKDRYVNLFETTIRVLGGLLSAYHLTGDQMFVEKADDLGNRLLSAFTSSKSAVPLSDVNLKTRKAKSPPWSSESSLSEVTSLQLEFRDLSRVTGKNKYEGVLEEKGLLFDLLPLQEIAFKVSKHIHDIGCGDHDGGTTITFGARADSYYEYLLKQWLQTGKTIDWLISDYEKAMTSMKSKLLRYSEPNKYGFVGELVGDTYSPKMDHLVCFVAGTLALGSRNGQPEEHMKIAEVSLWLFFDLMESFYLAETLKYLYLLFADDQKNLFPLDKWVFNTEAHPLPIYSN
ncbi:unnamed protein product [Nippostrongylus brasiliensis]|uniref:alpha-1,2-Mannosidase n=1 Tax=Nippostrongylus brasiliensis TaxID=27835 RepID=A0A0N4YC41_NIPBR|nr:unnamed protein product [Nippostrongylus brasiliensis]